MPFDQKTRNLLQRTVTACRKLLDEEFAAQRRGTYGINDDGTAAPLATLAHLPDEDMQVAQLLRDRLDHLVAGLVGQGKNEADARKEAVGRLTREQAFTVLNRLAALRMAEERGIVLECVRHGLQSEGFLLFQQSAGSAFGDTWMAYRAYLFVLFDELAVDLGVLFSRWDPAGLLFPRQEALEAVLGELGGTGNAAARDDLTPEAFNHIWAEDETIGWIYQYYNDPAERKKMRDESAAPRNSRELAVRNQFFTPRYVVEFLTDNTLGRIWYEMTQGNTHLKDQCRYLVRRPNEIFLSEGEAAPSNSDNPQSAIPNPQSQEELLQQPVFVPHRPLKDPRTILMLDPACGSLHFGLYAFDLFEEIYEEAWDMAERMKAEGRSMKELEAACPEFSSFILHTSSFQSKDEFLRQVPRLIIEHNIHGIDIDPRCAQIAGLSLWLRAQKSWQRLGLTASLRPTVTRSNIVCAEPMPGEKELLREFVEREFPPEERGVFLRLLEAIFDKMQLAGEAGSLLKIEEEIRAAIDAERAKHQEEFDFEGQQLTSDTFWQQFEARVYTSLRDYAEQAENGGGFQRRLFAEDAARGFAFIDICSKHYDVALMNPPFGDASLPSKPYIEETYGDTKGDVYKAFVECFHARLVRAGYLGIISSRTGFFLGQSEDWRTRVVLRLFRPIALADLGSGVLDAMVEVAAYVLRSLSAPEARDLTHSIVPVLGKVVRDSQDRFSLPKWQAARGGLKRHQAVAELEHLEAHGFVQRSSGDTVRYTPLWPLVKEVTAPPEPTFPPLVCVQALVDQDKGAALVDGVRGENDSRVFVCDPGSFTDVPGSPFAYWTSLGMRRLFAELPSVEGHGRDVESGASTKSDFRFLRLRFERPENEAAVIESGASVASGAWVPFAKGGAVVTFYADLNLTVNWRDNGAELKALISEYRGSRGWGYQWTAELKVMAFSFRPGVTWGRRSTSLAFRLLPRNAMFADKGPAILVQNDQDADLLALAAVVNSRTFAGLVAIQLARVELAQSFEVGLIQRTPFPRLSSSDTQTLAELARRIWAEKRALDSAHAASHAFFFPALLAAPGSTLADRAAAWAARVRTSEETVAAIQAEIDDLAFRLYGLDAADRAALTSTLATEATGDAEAEAGEDEQEEAATADATALTADLLGYGLGVAFGRWDIRYATGEQAAPELPDPFAPLPVCPPGQLQNAQGLPVGKAESGKLKAEGYPIDIPWDGILVDDPNHPLDIERRIREVLGIIWGGSQRSEETAATPESIEHEACEILGVKSLREYFRKPAGLFADHLKRYSKSRRQAPIYWPLSTASGSYTLWIYYHRLDGDTLYKCLQQFVEPKIKETEDEIHRLRTMLAADEAGTKERKQLADAESLLTELRALHATLSHWAPRWKPNLNDGVVITASPLWELFRLPKWQKTLKETWQELEKGDYDWAHLALTLWPERVREKCKKDRSLAIAHNLEDLCEIKAPDPKKRAAKKAAKKTEGTKDLDGLL
ncbi:MAG: SAM-dependent methyltransferase [Verrucomicrobia bacterium]|nr:SAM-dependent methyltransferase [Verrucomicrobiota bacterium]